MRKTDGINKKSGLKKTTKMAPVKAERPLALVAVNDDIALLAIREDGSLVTTKSSDGFNFHGRRFRVKIILLSGKEEKDLSIEKARLIKLPDGSFKLSFLGKQANQRALFITKSTTDLREFTIEHIILDVGLGITFTGKEQKTEPSIFFERAGSILARPLSPSVKAQKIPAVSIISPRGSMFDSGSLIPMNAFETDHGMVLLYDASRRKDRSTELIVGAALISIGAEPIVLWRASAPFWSGLFAGENAASSLGAVLRGDDLIFYWTSPRAKLLAVVAPNPFTTARKSPSLSLKRFSNNPIIEPISSHNWESEGTFNPGALYHDDRVHIIYRAVGRDGVSTLGYAGSPDGFTIDERLPYPIYAPREMFEGVKSPIIHSGASASFSGGGWGGCEDPKLTFIKEDGKVYMTYVAHNGYSPQRVVLTSIPIEDFANKRFNWSRPVLMSNPNVVDKSACLLPERINGRYVIFHRVFPDVLVDFVDDLSFGEGCWLKGEHIIPTRPWAWDSRKLSIGAPPIKTPKGWLTIYHAIDDRDASRYKIGAMLLDKQNPVKVLARSRYPILEPEANYENEGKFGVVYPCGAVVRDGELLVYYGGGDRVTCLATAPLDEFLWQLTHEIKPKLVPKRGILAR